MCRLLRSAGLSCEGFDAAGKFLAQLPGRIPECLVLDVQMPGMTGHALAAELRRQAYSFPIVFMTAHDDFDPSALGAVLVRKPFLAEALFAALPWHLRTLNPQFASLAPRSSCPP